MFYSLTGKVINAGMSDVVIECSGVGFRCFTSSNTLYNVTCGETVTLFTHLYVREDALDLYGFTTEYELEWFRMLISVNGVGPKAALSVLSVLPPEKLALSISANDVKSITKAQNVGPKIAQRIILDLKDKVKSVVSASSAEAEKLDSVTAVNDMENTSEAVAALTMLGYTQSEASVAVSKLDSSLSVENLIKGALRILSM